MNLPPRVMLLALTGLAACAVSSTDPSSTPQVGAETTQPPPDPALVNPHTEPSDRLAHCTARIAPGDDPAPAMRPGATLCFRAGVHPVNLVLTTPLTLVGEPGAILDGAGNGPTVHIDRDRVTVTLDGLSLTGGQHAAGGGLRLDKSARVRLEHVHFAGNQPDGLMAQAGQLTVKDCTFAATDRLVLGGTVTAEVLGTTVSGQALIQDGARVRWTGGSAGTLNLVGSAERVPQVRLQDLDGPVSNDPDHPAALTRD